MTMRRLRPLLGWTGAALAAGVLLPPFDGLADRSFAWHMVQHLVVMLAAVPLLLLGAYGAPWQKWLSRRANVAIAGATRSAVAGAVLCAPVGWVAMAGALWYAHLSGLFTLALEYPAVHAFEHGLLFLAAVLFWLPVIGNVAWPALPYPARLLYLFLALPQGALLSAVLLTSRTALYAPYVAQLGAAGALADQRNAAGIMWIGGGIAVFAAVMIVAGAWARREYAREVSA